MAVGCVNPRMAATAVPPTRIDDTAVLALSVNISQERTLRAVLATRFVEATQLC